MRHENKPAKGLKVPNSEAAATVGAQVPVWIHSL